MARVEQALFTGLGAGVAITGHLVRPFINELGPVVTYRAARAWGEREIKIRKRLTKAFAAPVRKVVFVQTYG